MNSQLQTVLMQHLASDWESNPALTTLVHDYTKYHAVVSVLGAVLLIVSISLWILFLLKFNNISATRKFGWPFEKKVYFFFWLTLGMFSLFFGLIFASNLSTTIKPMPGFTALATSTTVPSNSAEGTALIEWVKTGSSTMPPALSQKIEDRIHWQRPKAIICTFLFSIFVFVNVYLWRYLIERSRVLEGKWPLKDRLLIIAGGVTFGGCLLLVLMAVANAQGAIGPVAISILGVGG